ncbi:glycosyltransferase [Acinetobacter ursingii]|uniref:glycosyltransferase n=1 Tax=Acinetobacter ursingii TaxID=108980 RepID=UPI00126993D1|nr:glycosyltransferase [Acinetobacter ursingii]
MLLSLIIPVYKVEKYIKECLDSIIIQLPKKNVEVIIVDDGSPDNSLQIINHYLSNIDEDVRHIFKIIIQENKGLSGARNTGIEASTGRYLGFLDSDDILYDNYFDTLLDIISFQDVDIVEFEATRFNDKGEIFNIWQPILESGRYVLNINVLDKVATQSAWYAWKRIYKKELFEEIKFPIGKNFEDIYTTPYIYLKANTIFFINEVLVNYRYNPDSITNVISDKNLKDMKDAILKLSMVIDDHSYYMSSLISSARMYVQMLIQNKGIFSAYLEWMDFKKQLKFSQRKDIVKKYVSSKKHLLFYQLGFFVAFLIVIRENLKSKI